MEKKRSVQGFLVGIREGDAIVFMLEFRSVQRERNGERDKESEYVIPEAVGDVYCDAMQFTGGIVEMWNLGLELMGLLLQLEGWYHDDGSLLEKFTPTDDWEDLIRRSIGHAEEGDGYMRYNVVRRTGMTW